MLGFAGVICGSVEVAVDSGDLGCDSTGGGGCFEAPLLRAAMAVIFSAPLFLCLEVDGCDL